jgi:hypothetical protein
MEGQSRFSNRAASRDTMPIRPATNQVSYPRNTRCEKVHNQGRPFKNQYDNSTGENTCQASITLAVRLIDKEGILVDNGFIQGTVVNKGVEVPRW